MHSVAGRCLAFALAALTGCASIPEPPLAGARAPTASLSSFEFTGRLSIRKDDKGQSAHVRWSRAGGETDIRLSSPLGQVVAEIHATPGYVLLTLPDKRQFAAPDGESLTRDVLGYSVPVRGLDAWLLGQPVDGSPAQQTFRPDGLTDTLKQDGWLIQYPSYVNVQGTALPRQIVLAREDLQIRLVVDDWRAGTTAR